MRIKTLVLKNFRNLKDCYLDVSSRQVVLIGPNGQGKTNLLEALYLLCYGSSFRTQNLNEAIRYGESNFTLLLEFEDSDAVTRKIELIFDKTKKTIKLDSKEVHDRKEIIYCLPCIIFSHDDISFVRGEPEFRRRFFDQTMSMYDPVFFDDLRRYKLVLRQRNAAIKDQRLSLLPLYDEKLATYGLQIMKDRRQAARSFGEIFPDIYDAVSCENRGLKINYRPSWGDLDDIPSIVSKLEEQRDTDLKLQTTTSGPHRDRYILTDKNGLFTSGASTGQMRLASLVFRSAQAVFFRQKTSQDPIFLIDDVLLELDSEKRARYLDYLGHYNQAFFTFLPDEKYFSKLSGDSMVFNVHEGEFKLGRL